MSQLTMPSVSVKSFLNLESTSYLTLLNVSYVLAILLLLGYVTVPESQNATLKYVSQNPLVSAILVVALAYGVSYYYTKQMMK